MEINSAIISVTSNLELVAHVLCQWDFDVFQLIKVVCVGI